MIPAIATKNELSWRASTSPWRLAAHNCLEFRIMCWRIGLQKFRILPFDETLICSIFYIPLEAGLH
jgi:hypothetical protein